MLLLDLSLPTAAENLALDEALLDAVDEQPNAPELLRLWECPEYAVVLGRSCKVADEVNLTACETDQVPILRRTSGGGTVLIGPGCLMYSLRLSYERRPHLRMLDQVHQCVLNTTAAALNGLFSGAETRVDPRGTSDLAIGDQKISGNSLRCKRNFLLYHGTLLHDFDLTLVERYLRSPPREPAYREQRPHREFVANLPLDDSRLKASLIEAWQATLLTDVWPQALTQQLIEQRYSNLAWNFER